MAKQRRIGKLAVILHADIAGSTLLVHQDEQLTHERIQESFRRFGDTITRYHGRVRELRGDALLAEFERASEAVSAALAFQEEQADYLRGLDDGIQPTVRVGIAMGEVVIADNTITGAGVVLAQRLEQLSEPGGMIIQSAARDTIPNRYPFTYSDLGAHQIKGFDQPVQAYDVGMQGDASIPPPDGANHRLRNGVVALVGIAVIAVGAAMLWMKPWQPREETASVERMAFPLPDKPSIAVLPFDNLSGDPSQDAVSDGITEDLTTDLSKISSLFVIARNSAFQYKGKSIKVAKIAEKLGVQYIVEGSVRQSGNQIRINAQLIDATTGGHVWADRYDGSTDNVFSVQDDFVRRIVDALEVKLTSEEEEEIGLGNTSNLAAREAFQKGWNQFLRYTPIDNAEAVSHFKTALELDPEYGKAYAAMGMSYLRGCQLRWHEPLQMGIDDAYAAAGKYQGLMKTYPSTLANVASSQISLYRGQHKIAFTEATRAITTDPNDPEGYVAMAWSMITDGNGQVGLEMMDKARRLNPTHQNYYYFAIGMAYYSMGELDQAAKVFAEALDKDPGATQLAVPLAVTYANLGKRNEAQEALNFWKQNPTQEELLSLPYNYHFPYKWADGHSEKKNQFVDGLQLAVLPSDITVSSLASDLEQGDDKDRRVAAARLGLFGPAAIEAVSALINALNDDSKTVGKLAARALGKIGPGAQAAIPALKAVKEPIVAAEARKSIKLISGG